MKKQLLLLAMGIFFLTACSNNSSTEVEEGQILYSGTVEEINEESIFMINLEPVDNTDVPGFDEVILLTEPPAELERGDKLDVILIENAPTTMSIPPQIPGNAIVEVTIVE